jgi:nicotinic acid mononucleotide adenylyltransferase
MGSLLQSDTQLNRQSYYEASVSRPALLAPLVGELHTDVVVVGNVMSRGNPLIEAVLEQGLPYVSGPEWLAEHVLRGRWVIAVAGTHGKTTTTSMVAWILEHAGLEPGFLVGGIPANFGVSARLGTGRHFVVEADEYDTAFFDKRAKFVHYRPRTAILNNLEYDHADIYANVEAIEAELPVPSYTVDTLRALASRYPEHQLRLVVGADILPQVDAWRDWPTIAQRWPPLIVGRAGHPSPGALIEFPEVSSTDVRQRLRAGLPIEALVTARVAQALHGADPQALWGDRP